MYQVRHGRLLGDRTRWVQNARVSSIDIAIDVPALDKLSSSATEEGRDTDSHES